MTALATARRWVFIQQDLSSPALVPLPKKTCTPAFKPGLTLTKKQVLLYQEHAAWLDKSHERRENRDVSKF